MTNRWDCGYTGQLPGVKVIRVQKKPDTAAAGDISIVAPCTGPTDARCFI